MTKRILIFTLILVAFLLSGCGQKAPTSLDAPILKSPDKTMIGKYINIEGSGYPKSKLLIFINDEYKYDSQINKDGNFTYKLKFDKDANYIIKVKQSYLNVTSDFSNEISFITDVTPPKNTLNIKSSIPTLINVKELKITGIAEASVNIFLNNKIYEVDRDGNFFIDYELQEGINQLSFKLGDDFGNTTEEILNKSIILDTIPPKIVTAFCSSNQTQQPTEEYVCLKHGDFWGYFPTTYSMPIEGNTSGNFQEIKLDNKKIIPDENSEIYQKIPLYLSFGTNKFKIVAKDLAGNQSSAYLEIGVEKDSEDINVNIND